MIYSFTGRTIPFITRQLKDIHILKKEKNLCTYKLCTSIKRKMEKKNLLEKQVFVYLATGT